MNQAKPAPLPFFPTDPGSDRRYKDLLDALVEMYKCEAYPDEKIQAAKNAAWIWVKHANFEPQQISDALRNQEPSAYPRPHLVRK